MKRNTDYTSDAVRDSIQKTMSNVKAYFEKNWAQGKEYKVITHIQKLLDAEIDKYLPSGKAGDAYRTLAAYVNEEKKYAPRYEKYLEKFGPYVMELLVEYANSLTLTGRYDVGDRYEEVSDDIFKKLETDFLSDKNIGEMIDRESADINKFMAQHNIKNYTIETGSVCLAINVNDDITLVKQDAPRGVFRHEFLKVKGSFICEGCGLTTLQFGPKEVGGDFDCSNNKLSIYCLENAPKIVGGDFIWRGNEGQVTLTEIMKHTKVGGKIITDAPMTPAEKEIFKQQVIKEQDAFLAEFTAKGKLMDKAVQEADIKTLEACREYFYNAIDFFKERPWITQQGMKISYQVLLKIYVHLHNLDPVKYPDTINESSKLSRLTNKAKYPDGWNW